MRVLQVLYSGLGGHGSVAFSIIEEDQKNENEYTFIFYGIEMLREEYKKKCESGNNDYFTIQKKKGLDLFSFVRFIYLLFKIKPDTVLLHSALILPTKIYKIFSGCKIVCIEHQNNSFKSKKALFISKCNIKLADKVIMLTPDYFNLFNKALSFNGFSQVELPDNIEIIPNGVSEKVFYPKIKKQEVKKIIFGMASRINSLRDHSTVFKALRDLKNEGLLFEFLVAGSGDSDCAIDKLQQEVIELGIDNEVVFLGNLNQDKMNEFFGEIDVYIHSSKAETLSTSILQAMACKLPIIATNIDGISNMLLHNINALLFDLGDWKQLKKSINKMLDSPGYKEQIAVQAYSLFKEKYSSKAMFDSYQALISQ